MDNELNIGTARPTRIIHGLGSGAKFLCSFTLITILGTPTPKLLACNVSSFVDRTQILYDRIYWGRTKMQGSGKANDE